MFFVDRAQAGRQLADALAHYRDQPAVVFGIVRGGVPLAVEVARSLNAPLDILIPSRIPVPHRHECSECPIARIDHMVQGTDASVDPNWMEWEELRERDQDCRCRDLYLADRARIPVEGKIAVLVDDGIATGLTIKLAIRQVRERSPGRIVVAVPVIPYEAHQWLLDEVDEVVALETPEQFASAVAEYQEDFRSVEEDDISRTLRECALR